MRWVSAGYLHSRMFPFTLHLRQGAHKTNIIIDFLKDSMLQIMNGFNKEINLAERKNVFDIIMSFKQTIVIKIMLIEIKQ